MTTTWYAVGDPVDVDLGGGQFCAGEVVAVAPAADGSVWEYDVRLAGLDEPEVITVQPRYVRPSVRSET